jgi:hypothetical protein
MNDLIAVPVNLVSLGAAVTARVDALTVDSDPNEVLAVIALLETLDDALDRLAMEFEPVTALDTYADTVAA